VPAPGACAYRKIELKLLQRWSEATSAGALVGRTFYIGVGMNLGKASSFEMHHKLSAARKLQAKRVNIGAIEIKRKL
jgi:hypothetical protein